MINLTKALPRFLEESNLTPEMREMLSNIEVRIVFQVGEREESFEPNEQYISMGSIAFEYDEQHDNRFDFHRWETQFHQEADGLKLAVCLQNLDIDFLIEESKSAEAFPLTPTPELLAQASLGDIYIDWEFPAELTLEELVVRYPLSDALGAEYVDIRFNGADFPNVWIGN